MMVYDDCILIQLDRTIIHLTYTDTANILIIINRTDQNLCLCIRISLWCRDVIQDRLEQWLHICTRLIW